MMKLSATGLAHLKSSEGLRLDAYPDPGSSNGLPITIGYGSTTTIGGAAWHMGDRITEAEAAHLLRRDVAVAEMAVNRLVRVPLTQAQFDALVSFAFNVGEGAFSDSTLLRLLNAGDYEGAAAQFDRWVHNDGKKLDGLVRRRRLERAMFESAPVADAPTVPEAAPIVRNDTEAKPPTLWEKHVSPFLAAALPQLVKMIPELIRSFGSDGRVTERNAKAAEALLTTVQAATGAANAQDAIERLASDQKLLSEVRNKLEADAWFELTEAGGDGIAGARKAAAEVGERFWQSGVFWVTALLLPLLYGTVYLVLTGPDGAFSSELRAAIASSVVTGVLGGIIGYWLGLKFRTSRPTADN